MAARIAIRGFGVYGRRLYSILKHFEGSLSVTAVFDSDPSALPAEELPPGLPVLPGAAAAEEYRRGLFDSVVVGIRDPYVRRGVEEGLLAESVPVFSVPDLFSQHLFSPLPGNVNPASVLYSRLLDQESRDLFRARLWYALFDEEYYLRTVRRYSSRYPHHCYELDAPMERVRAKGVVLFGGGPDGELNRYELKLCGIPVTAFCVTDIRDAAKAWPGIPAEKIITAAELKENFQDQLIILSDAAQTDRMKEALALAGVPDERIYDPPHTGRAVLSAVRQGQYFDVWEPRPDEVFIDGGAYDGSTILDFYRWCGGKYEAIYALEPLPFMQERLRKICREIPFVTQIEGALWDREDVLSFRTDPDPSGSKVVADGSPAAGQDTFSVRGLTLDSVIPGRATFLKMDIEGSEMKALDGAQRLLKDWRPRLAVSLYHNPLDVLELPLRILELQPQYCFRIRHYGAGFYETVLYGDAGSR